MVEAVQQWLTPTSVSKVHSILGLPGYYHKFLKDFKKIAGPLTIVTRKEEKFIWDETCEEPF